MAPSQLQGGESRFGLPDETFQLTCAGGITTKGTLMTRLQRLLGLSICLATPAMAWEQVLIDHDKPAKNWRVTSEELGIDSAKPFSVSMRTLHGGRQEGVSLIEIDNGTMRMTVVPTRGMNVLEAVAGDVRLGWDSPVQEVVNPAFIELNGRGGLGWLEGLTSW